MFRKTLTLASQPLQLTARPSALAAKVTRPASSWSTIPRVKFQTGNDQQHIGQFLKKVAALLSENHSLTSKERQHIILLTQRYFTKLNKSFSHAEYSYMTQSLSALLAHITDFCALSKEKMFTAKSARHVLKLPLSTCFSLFNVQEAKLKAAEGYMSVTPGKRHR